ncbi:MAG: pitrilysin family protein [Verrucomicrobiota bacterium]
MHDASFAEGEARLLEQLFAHPPQRIRLDNGLTLITREDRSAELVSVQAWVKTGSTHEGLHTGSGLSHFLEHMLFKGTDRRGPLDISREVHAFGGYINAYTSYDRTVYYIDAPAEAAHAAYDILADMTLAARIPEEDFLSEREVILREIAMGADDPDRQLFYRFAETAFRTHPYRYPVIGLKPLFAEVTREVLYDYYRARYQPSNLVLVVVGALNAEEACTLAEETFGAAPLTHTPSVAVEAEPAQLAARTVRARSDVNIVRGMLGYKVPGLSAPEAPALDVFASILGRGRSSLLWRELREEQQLVQHIDAACWNPGSSGLLWMSYTCDEGKREAVEAAIEAILETKLAAELTAENLEKARRHALVGEVNARKSMSRQAAQLGVAETVVGELDYPRHYLQRLTGLQPEDLASAAATYLVPAGLTKASLEPDKAESISAPQVIARTGLADFTETVLNNGARLLIQADSSYPKAHLRLSMLGGAAGDLPEAPGACGVLASLLARDTAQADAATRAREVEQVGGSWSELIGNNTFGLSAEVLSGDFSLAAGWMTQALLELKPDESGFCLERDNQLASLLEDEDDILEFARRRLRRRFFGAHPLANDYLGTQDGLAALTLAQVEALRERLVSGPNVLLAIAGDVDPAAAIDLLGPALAQLRPDPVPEVTPLPLLPAETSSAIEHLPREQVVALEAYPDVGLCHEDYHLGEVLDECLSGMSSRLFESVREKAGLAYYVGANRELGQDAGMFTLYAGTAPGAEDKVYAAFSREVDRLAGGGVEADELAACKRRLKVARRQAMQAIGARTRLAVNGVHFGRGANSWREHDQRLEQVDRDHLTAFARARFDQARRLRLTVRSA